MADALWVSRGIEQRNMGERLDDQELRIGKLEQLVSDMVEWQKRQDVALASIENHLRSQAMQMTGLLIGVFLTIVAVVGNGALIWLRP